MGCDVAKTTGQYWPVGDKRQKGCFSSGVWNTSVNHEFAGFDSLLSFSLFFSGNFALYEKFESWKVAWRLEEDTVEPLGDIYF